MNQRLQLLGAIAAAGFWAAGCSSSHTTLVREPGTLGYPTGEEILREPAAEPRCGGECAAPGRSDTWVPGYWTCYNRSWIWIAGHRESMSPP